jgi:hypothetical protein
MFNLEARNKSLIMLKAASLGETILEKRAYWASLALHRLAQHIVKSSSVAEESKTNLLIQNIHVSQRDPPELHKTMVKCVNKYGVGFEVVTQPQTY